MVINLFSKNIKICSFFDLKSSFLKHYLIDSEEFEEIIYVKKYNNVSKFDKLRKVIYVNENDNPYQNLIYALREFYAVEHKEHLLLHASCISKNNNDAILFIGPPSSGKTTILRKALKMGYYYISEDLVFIKDNYCFLSPPFKVLEIDKFTKKAKIEKIYFINFRYGSKFVKVELNIEEKKKYLFESLFNTKALTEQFDSFKNLLKIQAYYVMYSNCEDLLYNL
ncbi:MAG: hypothetical protein ABIL89_05415 [candidate division WOR-3 bacterium]